jgi:hypothetical protein
LSAPGRRVGDQQRSSNHQRQYFRKDNEY